MCIVKSFTVTVSDDSPVLQGRTRTARRRQVRSSRIAVSICYELEYAETDLEKTVSEKVREAKRFHRSARAMLHNEAKERQNERSQEATRDGAEPAPETVCSVSSADKSESKASAAQLRLLRHHLEQSDVSDEDLQAELKQRFGKGTLEELTPSQARSLLFEMQQRERFQKQAQNGKNV